MFSYPLLGSSDEQVAQLFPRGSAVSLLLTLSVALTADTCIVSLPVMQRSRTLEVIRMLVTICVARDRRRSQAIPSSKISLTACHFRCKRT